MKTRLILLAAALLALTGCAITPQYNAKEVHRTMTYPLVFTDTVDAVGIEKVTNPDGSVTRRAETLTHSTTAGGFTRTSVYKGAEITTKEEKATP